MKNPEKAQHQNFLNAVYNATANAKSVQNGNHPEKNVLQKKIGYSAKNDKNQQFIGPNVGPINLLFVNVRLSPYLSVFVRKKGGRQFQSVILEGVTDFLRSGELGGKRSASASLSPSPSLFRPLRRVGGVQW